MEMAHRLKKLRSSRNLTLKEVAESLGVPASTYRDWEYGKAIRGEPYRRLAEIYGVSLGELLGGEPSSTQTEILKYLDEAKNKVEAAIKIVQAL